MSTCESKINDYQAIAIYMEKKFQQAPIETRPQEHQILRKNPPM